MQLRRCLIRTLSVVVPRVLEKHTWEGEAPAEPPNRRIRCLMPTLSVVVILISAFLAAGGCLRQRWQPADESFRDLPAIPQQDFGRPKEKRGQAGLDKNLRQRT